VNRPPVTAAPGPTWRQRRWVSGRNLNIVANRVVTTSSDTPESTSRRTATERHGSRVATLPATSVRNAVNARETNRTNAIARIIANETSRLRRKWRAPWREGSGGTSQMRSRAAWSWTSTPVAPNPASPTPRARATRLPPRWVWTCSTMSRICAAPSEPTSVRSCSPTARLATSGETNSPTTTITTTTSGATENIV
jgi:hypothetical protein